MKTTLLIMAVGIGSRFGTGIKQLEPVDYAFQDINDIPRTLPEGRKDIGVRPHKEKINISKEFINKTKGAVAPYAARTSQKSFDKSHPSPW